MTVVVADVAGSLAMAEALDPEDVHAVMDGFFALALEAVHGEGGTLNQFRGDGFMALFGAPRARGDDAARALRAVLALRGAAVAYGESVRARFALPFAVRFGVSSGLVWVGAIGDDLRRDYTAEGPTVGLAARLESAAAPGQILVDDATRRRCGEGFELADRGARRLRGLSAPARLFELLGEKRPAAPASGGATRFVGRKRALAALRRLLAAQGTLRCVEIRGEPGVGKTRLVREALRLFARESARIELVCRESGAERAYAPWIEALRRWPEALPGADGAARLLDAIEGPGVAAAPAPEAVAAALRELLAGALAAGPVALVVDDAQWLDPSSRALLERLTADPPAGSLAILATLRGAAPAGWGAAASPARVALGPLSEAEARRLARAVLGGVARSEALAELAFRRGGGNPLFVEEVARVLRDGAAGLHRAASPAGCSPTLEEGIPETLQGVVAARIDALPPPAKRLLEAAAAFGEPLDGELLAELEPQPDPGVQLAVLVRLGLLGEDARGGYDFCHGVVRSGAYAQLARGRRRALHRRIADALARREDGRTPGGAARIGAHCERAGDRAAAAAHLERAGDGYAALRAPREAAEQLRRSLEHARAAGADRGRAAGVGLKLAAVLSALDRSGEAARLLADLDPPVDCAQDRLRLAAARVHAGWVRFSHDGDLAGGRALIESGLQLAGEAHGASDAALLGSGFLARIDLLDGELARSLRAARRLRERAAARGDTAMLVLGIHHELAVHAEAGRVAAARRLAQQAAAALRGEEGALATGTARLARGRVHVLEGDVAGALEAASRVAEAGARAGQLGLVYHAEVLRGQAQLLAGAARAARDAFESLVALEARWPSTWLHVACGRLAVGELDAAAEYAARCLADGTPRTLRARALGVRGVALGLAGAPREEAEALLAESIALCEALGLRPARAEAQGFLAAVSAQAGDRVRARQLARRARRGYERCGMPRHAARISAAASSAPRAFP